MQTISHTAIINNQVQVTLEGGAVITLTIGEKGADLSYQPDNLHYPEPMERDDKGRDRYPTAFTPFK